ncbi:hypothetical protein Ciccas_007836 [Cichlidogyrus casuarinus]|uniref:G-protein coupled receptors family 1 profile domain-containing protein n=1 Tax=Cichlidogyrus casuarinus TaxID=1844966 RepID=A0ABD2Q1R8_9PLAT
MKNEHRQTGISAVRANQNRVDVRLFTGTPGIRNHNSVEEHGKFATMNETGNSWNDALVTYFCSWYLPLGFNLSAVLTMLCLTVLAKHPKIFASSTRIWFSAMMISDILILIISGNDFFFELFYSEQYHKFLFKVFGRYVCVIRLSIISFLFWNSLWLQSGLSIERLASVICPFKTRAFLTAHLTRFAVILTTAFTLISSLAANAMVRPNDPDTDFSNFSNCVENNGTGYDTLSSYYVDLFFRFFAFILMTVSSGILAVFLRYSRVKRSQLVYSISRTQRRVASSTYNRESRASFLLLVMNISTLLTNPIFIIFELLDGAASENQASTKLTKDPHVTQFLGTLFNVIMYINNQTNCIFFVAFGSKFRAHMINLICCRPGVLKSGASSSTVTSSVLKRSKRYPSPQTFYSSTHKHSNGSTPKDKGVVGILKHRDSPNFIQLQSYRRSEDCSSETH